MRPTVLARGRRLTLVLALKPLHAPGGIHELLLAGIEGVTLRAHLHADLRLGRAGADDLPARARDRRVDVVRMNASLHGPPPRSFNHTSGGGKTQKTSADPSCSMRHHAIDARPDQATRAASGLGTAFRRRVEPTMHLVGLAVSLRAGADAALCGHRGVAAAAQAIG